MGSPNGIWTAVSGGMAQSQNIDVVANNLANANTVGFKKDTPTFKEYLTAVERPPSPDIDIPRTIFKDSDFYHHDGREHAMVNLDKVHTDHSQGNMRVTNAPFDMAIDGPGFFAVKSPSGVMYTRAGDFKVDGTGQLVNQEGFPLLGLSSEAQQAQQELQTLAQNGGAQAPVAAATPTRSPASLNPFTAPLQVDPNNPNAKPLLQAINLREALGTGHKIHISEQGEVFAGEDLVAKLAIAEFVNPQLLQKSTSTMYANPDAANVVRVSSASKVNQGFLESSNVNPVVELMNLLKANRMYESNMRAIKTYNDMAGKEANEVGKL